MLIYKKIKETIFFLKKIKNLIILNKFIKIYTFYF